MASLGVAGFLNILFENAPDNMLSITVGKELHGGFVTQRQVDFF